MSVIIVLFNRSNTIRLINPGGCCQVKLFGANPRLRPLTQFQVYNMVAVESRSCFKNASYIQWLRCDSVLNAHVLRVRSAFKPHRRLALERNLQF